MVLEVMGFFRKLKFWKRKEGGAPTKVDKCVSAEGPRTCDVGTMTEGVASSAWCAELCGPYAYDAPTANCAEWCEPYAYDAPAAYPAEWCEPYAYGAPAAYPAEWCEPYAYGAQAAYPAE